VTSLSLSAHLHADAAALGVSLNPAEEAHILAFTELLARWNRAVRLAGPSDPLILLREQVVEALAWRALLPLASSWWDVGSGGGLPALVLAGLSPGHRFHLIEPVGKKVAFLKQATVNLGLSARVSVHLGRLDDGATLPPSAAALAAPPRAALSRATFPPERWYALAAPLVGPGGHVLIASATALDQPFAVAARRDGRLAETVAHLPATGAPRWLTHVTVPPDIDRD
jgi:16S rRNA G527 N7-methylase RsmG